MKTVIRSLLFAASLFLLGQMPGPLEGQGSSVPKVLRPACTDHVCGGCDGRCHDPAGIVYDHVTVQRDGHCACTPRPGGDLDRALREAYRRWMESVRR